MLLLRLFYSEEKPILNMFLRPIIDDINSVYRQGLFWTLCVINHGDKCVPKTDVPVQTPSGDMLARAILQSTFQLVQCSLT